MQPAANQQKMYNNIQRDKKQTSYLFDMQQ